jgi:uncharacterized DUF497 family protein
MIFIWDEQNQEHAARHGVSHDEAEYVVDHARPPFPRNIEGQKQLVRGQTEAGRWIQVIFVYIESDRVDIMDLPPEDLLALEQNEEIGYIIHARDLTRREKIHCRRN